jgi:HEAT repeat protein
VRTGPVALIAVLVPVICAAADLRSETAHELVQQFRDTPIFWQQFEVGESIVALKDRSVVPDLVGYLSAEDRHVRANAAFVFAGLGDLRGFEVLESILADLSDRPDAQGMAGVGGGIASADAGSNRRIERQRHTHLQIESDRYYAAHVLGELRDPRAVPALISVLKEPNINLAAIWSLAEIGDHRAVSPLISLLASEDPTVRVIAIRALEKLRAKEAIPALYRLLDDKGRSHVDDLIPVADAARQALNRLGAR